jgi:UDP-N-acetyl-D-mannosaminuronate dehydrogenase
MTKETVLIIGLGEVGQTLYDLFKESGKFDVYGLDADKNKMQSVAGDREKPRTVDVMHICFRCAKQQTFVQTTADYMQRIKPKLTIIDSTVPPETTKKIFKLSKLPLVHSPIQGMHKTLETMKNDVKFWNKYVGGTTKEAAETARKHFEKLGLKVKILKGPAETELAKLYDTTYMAWMIACFQEMHRIARKYGADFDEVVEMIEDIQRARLNKPLHYPGVIGGHCLIPNTELLLSVYDSEFLRLILESNEKRKKEIKNRDVFEEVEKVKKRAEALQKELMRKLSQRRS